MTDKLKKLEEDVKGVNAAVMKVTIIAVITTLLAVATVGCVAIGTSEVIATCVSVDWLVMTLCAGGGLISVLLALDVIQVSIEMIRREIGGQK
jgi:hypothetical protein